MRANLHVVSGSRSRLENSETVFAILSVVGTLHSFSFLQRSSGVSAVEDRVVPLMLPVRDWKNALLALTGSQPAASLPASASPVALLWLSLGESGALLDALLTDPQHLGYGGVVLAAMGGGHVPEPLVKHLAALAGRLPVVVASRAGGGPLLRRTYESPGSEIALRAHGLIYAGRLPPLKARLLLDLLLRAGTDRAGIAALFDLCG